eukprot:TRINITY_DN15337_c0_g1_i1.p2 TRINITY_DN15337_c0_g1~~TRINITY_DN15337_c0_g1_i1.p2  ORF type:complete len:214 (-),score=54.01 TRINITY_DN15337_c0_g1_i1:14-655(-)
MTVADYAACHPLLFPFRHYPPPAPALAARAAQPVAAVVVMNDPTEWGETLQVLVDVLQSDGIPGNVVAEQRVQLFLSNPDFLWSAEFSQPRFGQGAFNDCLRLLFRQTTGRELHFTQFGKPSEATYAFAEDLLHQHHGPVDLIYGVGDNPAADIRGANLRAQHPARRAEWASVFVQTGNIALPHPSAGRPHDQPQLVFRDIHHAVTELLGVPA